MVGCEMRFYQGAFTLSLYEQFDTIADKVQYKLFHPAEANFWSVFYDTRENKLLTNDRSRED